MNNFWQNLSLPFTALAPMDGVTDPVFRTIISSIGKPDVLFTEFVSCDRIIYGSYERRETQLLYEPCQQPIVAQIWGTDPEMFYRAAKRINELGFAGIDINMGCPVQAVIKDGACSGLMHTPDLAAKIIHETVRGAGELPVSVKTRIGFDNENIDSWIGFLLRQNLKALTIHLRTVAEESKADAHWDLMPQIIDLRDLVAPKTMIIGNGDISSMEDIKDKYAKFGCDGFMVGRGIFTNPWLFSKTKKMDDVTVKERLDLYLYHIELYKELYPAKNFGPLKKFARIYIKHFEDSARLRDQTMNAVTLEELEEIVRTYRDRVR